MSKNQQKVYIISDMWKSLKKKDVFRDFVLQKKIFAV